MGSTFQQAFPEIWDTIGAVFDKAEDSGVAVDVKEQLLFVERNGFVEEAYFTGNFNPLRGDDGYVGGFYNSVHGKQYSEQCISCSWDLFPRKSFEREVKELRSIPSSFT